MGLKDAIFSADDIDRELVEVPEWGVTVEVRAMSTGDRARAMQHWTDEEGKVDVGAFYPNLLVASVFDPETGETVFDPDDVEKLNAKSAAVIERLAQVAVRLSGMNPEAVDEAGEGSSPTQNGDSSST